MIITFYRFLTRPTPSVPWMAMRLIKKTGRSEEGGGLLEGTVVVLS